MVKACIFDWGGVIIDDPSSGFVQYFSKKLHINPTELGNIFPLLMKEYTLGLSENEFWKKVYTRLSVNPSIPFPIWSDSLPTLFQEKKKITDIISQLRSKGKKVGLLSNAELPTAKAWFIQSYAHLFDAAIFSCFEKIAKPDPRIYKIILNKLSVNPEEAVFVDDRKENIKTAEDLGMRGILFTNEDEVIKELLNLA